MNEGEQQKGISETRSISETNRRSIDRMLFEIERLKVRLALYNQKGNAQSESRATYLDLTSDRR
jgi:hypothetical protein